MKGLNEKQEERNSAMNEEVQFAFTNRLHADVRCVML